MATDKKVVGTLVGCDSNIFAVFGHFQKLARRQGWKKEEIQEVLEAAQEGDYNHALVTIMDYMEEPEEIPQEGDHCRKCETGEHECNSCYKVTGLED